MGKKNKDKKGKGKEKTEQKTEKKAAKRAKKELAEKGEVRRQSHTLSSFPPLSLSLYLVVPCLLS